MVREWVSLVLSLPAISITLWVQVIYPRYFELTPEVTVIHTIATDGNEVLHHYLFRNSGNAPARDLGFLFECEPSIKRIESSKSWDKLTGGEGHTFVELSWKELEPGDIFYVSIVIEKTGVLADLYPRMYKVWHKGGLVDRYGSGG